MMRRNWAAGLVASAGLLGFAAIAVSQNSPNGAETPTPGAIREAVEGAKGEKHERGEKPDKPKRFGDFKELTKDMQELEGLFTVFRFDPADKERDPEKLLAKIPRSLLNDDLLFATTLTKGGPMTGYQWADALIRFEVSGNQLKIVTPDTRLTTKESHPVADVVKRTYSDTYLAAVPILAMTPGGDVLIDLSPLLKSNIADAPTAGGNIRPDLSTWSKVKTFPDNVVIEVDLAVAERTGGGRSLGVGYAFRRLPKLGTYSARQADPRVGYFLTARQDWSKPAEERETFDRLVNRWQLEKRDPTLELSPPKQPIVFIIEKTVPIQWRRWVRDGILEWNKAYEKVGFTDAIVVQQQTDDNEYKDYDPEDARYNFIRWIVSGRAFAMGPSRVDPRTGQILDADIIFDDSFVRAWLGDFDIFAPSTLAAMKGEGFIQFLKDYPQLMPRSVFPYDPNEAPADPLRAELDRKMHEMGRCNCSYAWGMQHQMQIGRLAYIATATGKKLPERFFGEAIKLIVTHEVGHTLGLRHNFKGSAWLGLDEIRRRRSESDEPSTGSVMDYNPLLFFAGEDPEKLRHFVTPTIGPYDYWAIEYGYASPDKGKNEKEMLKEVAGRCAQPGLAYATDEDTIGTISPDPTSNRYDLSTDSVAWAKSRIELCDKLLPEIAKTSVKPGEPKYYITEAFNTLWYEKARNFDYVARVIGGQYVNRDQAGDADARPAFVIVDSNTQRDALKFISESVLTDEFFNIDPAVLNELAAPRWSHWGMPNVLRVDYPVHDRITTMQMNTLMDVTNPMMLQRVYDAELKTADPHKLTAAELVVTTRNVVWSALDQPGSQTYTDAKPYISSISRNLQRKYLDVLVAQARFLGGSPAFSPDLHSMVCGAMRELSEKIGKRLEGGNAAKLDFASRSHLTECKSRIDRALDAQFQAI